jgi:hypothetical protein
VTLYGLPAFEGAFLSEEFQQTSIAVGFDGAITVVDPAATDPITAHGTYSGLSYLHSHHRAEFCHSQPRTCRIKRETALYFKLEDRCTLNTRPV